MNTKNLAKKIATIQSQIARKRDELDALIAQATELRDDCQDAFESLDYARDALSRTQ